LLNLLQQLSPELIAPVLASLDQEWQNLEVLTAARSKALEESHAYFNFKGDQDDELRWLEQQIRVLENAEPVGDSLTSGQVLNKKHEAFLIELGTHDSRVQSVNAAGSHLASKSSSRESEIRAGEQQLNEKLALLKDLAHQRKIYLEGALKRLTFNRDASEIEHFVKDYMPLINSTYIGNDVATTQNLLEELDEFSAKADATGELVKGLMASKDSIVRSNHPDGHIVERKAEEVARQWEEFVERHKERRKQLENALGDFKVTDSLCLTFAERAASLNNWLDNTTEDLSDSVTTKSLEEAERLQQKHNEFKGSLDPKKAEFDEMAQKERELQSRGITSNPYTPFKADMVLDKWFQIQRIVEDRTVLLVKEVDRQRQNEELRIEFAKLANALGKWIDECKTHLLEGNLTLEEQLGNIKTKNAEIKQKQEELKVIEYLSSKLEAALVLDNKHTEHSAVALAQKLDALKQLGVVMEYNTEQKIIAKNSSGVTEEQRNEWIETFDYFDKDHSGTLDYQEFKSCLRGCGYDLPVVAEGQVDVEFEQIIKFVDSDSNKTVSKDEFVDFMISQRSTKATNANEVINSFVMIAHDKPFVSEDELRATLPANQVDYCIRHMTKTPQGYDYKEFVNTFFAASSDESHPNNTAPQKSQTDGWATARSDKVKSSQQKHNQQKEEAETKAKEQEARFQQEKAAREAARASLLEKK